MSHYSVAVFSKENGYDVDELLAPYDENIVVDRYVFYTKDELIKRGETAYRLFEILHTQNFSVIQMNI